MVAKKNNTANAAQNNFQPRSFSAKIFIIGVNPYVFVPAVILKKIFIEAKKNTSPIQVYLTLNAKKFEQNLVRYKGKWRLYLNTPMRKHTVTEVGDMINIEIEYDPDIRTIPMHPKLKDAFSKNKTVHDVFKQLTPSRQKEIIRYISFLKTEESVDRNIEKVMRHLSGKERFAGRD
jgi:hypothetical protein